MSDIGMMLLMKVVISIIGHVKHWDDDGGKDCVAMRMKVKSYKGNLPQQETEKNTPDNIRVVFF